MSYIAARRKRERKKRRNQLLEQLSQDEYDYFQKNRLRLFKKSYYQQTGCGCCLGFLFGAFLTFVALSNSQFTWGQKWLAFLVVWLIYTLVFPIVFVWETKVDNEIEFLESIIKLQSKTRQEMVYQLYNALVRVAEKKKTSTEIESVFITKN